MSEPKLMSNNDYILGDSLKPMTQEMNNEIYYNCSECSSPIEITLIDEKNNIIEFNCLNNDNNNCNHEHKKIKISIKEYFKKMKKYNQQEINNDECKIHKNKYISYCFNCKCHLLFLLIV